MVSDRRTPVAAFLTRYDRVCEVGIGRRPAVARRLVERGVTVTATDIESRSVPDGVRFVVDDILDASERVAAGEQTTADDDLGDHYDADAIYALNCPPELHRPLSTVARAVGADCLFTTLGGDSPAIPVERHALDGGETLYLSEYESESRSGTLSK